MLTVLLTVYVTLGIIQVCREIAKPYGGSFWLLDFLFAPYILTVDFIHEFKIARNIDKYNGSFWK